MTDLERVFKNGKAFIPFITAGDPTLEITERLIFGMAEAGADLIELGIPFSDPVAEGPVIQQADIRALSSGTTTNKIFEMLLRIRPECDVPIAFMTYANPVFSYGPEQFMKNCSETKVCAVIVPDVPYEEREEFLPYCRKYGVELIHMISPASHERIRMIARDAGGFLYCVSSLGVTGIREQLGDEITNMIKLAKEVNNIPCAVGFGISNPDQARQICEVSDGVIVGSAIVKIIEQYGEKCLPYVIEYVKKMKQAVSCR